MFGTKPYLWDQGTVRRLGPEQKFPRPITGARKGGNPLNFLCDVMIAGS